MKLPENNTLFKVDPVKVKIALANRQMTLARVSNAYGKNYTYASQRLIRYNNTFPQSLIAFIERVYGIKAEEYVIEPVNRIQTMGNQERISRGLPLVIDGKKIRSIVAKANLSLYRASLDLGYKGSYLNCCISRNAMSLTGVKHFMNYFGCNAVDVLPDGATPPVELCSREDVTQDNTESVKTETDVTQDNVGPVEVDTDVKVNDALRVLNELIEKVKSKELCVDRSIVLDFSKLIEDAVYNGVKRALNE